MVKCILASNLIIAILLKPFMKLGAIISRGDDLKDLPGCHGKKITREMKILKNKIPELRDHIQSGSGKGYRLILKK